MLSRRMFLTGAGVSALLGGCSQMSKVGTWIDSNPLKPTDQAARLKEVLDKLAVDWLREQPTQATSLGVSEAQAGGRFGDRLGDASPAGMQRRASIMANAIAEIDRVDRSRLSPQDRISCDVVHEALSERLAGARFGWGNYGFQAPTPYAVTQYAGSYINVPSFLDAQQPLKNSTDVDDYLSRLAAFATVLDQETARLQADAGKGVVPPDFALDGALKQLGGLASKKAGDTILVQSLKRRIADATGVDAPHAKEAMAHATTIVADKVLPAMHRQLDALKALRKTAVHDAGVWRLKDGDEFYRVALRASTTSSLSPDEIHKMGLDLLKDFNAQMDEILKAQGLTKGSVAERTEKLAKDKKQLDANTDAGRAEILKDLNGQIAALQPILPHYFGTLAKARLEIRRVPPYKEAGSAGGYYESGSLDGTRPGAYYINLRNTAEWPKFSLPTLTYHEGEPGHHWQISIAHESTELPLVRSALLGFSGYSEGWALYAEMLADEMGCYKENPLGRLGYLQSGAFRAGRLVVDTGIHTQRWSREKAIDFMVEATGDQRSSLTTEVERYSVWPGQACSYMVGRETIRKAREDAMAALGSKFDIRDFHDVVLRNGAMPLSVVSSTVKAWVAAQLEPPTPYKS